jgi:hypothetical protein
VTRMMKPSAQDLESVRWPVRLWWAAEYNMPGFLAAERRFWRAVHAVTEPRAELAYWRKRLARPGIGGRVIDCRGQVHIVVAFNGDRDSLILEDGHRCSWMNCCDPLPPRGRP